MLNRSDEVHGGQRKTYPGFEEGGLIDNLPVAVLLLDSELRVVAANSRAAEYHQVPLAKLAGVTCSDLPSDYDVFRTPGKKCFSPECPAIKALETNQPQVDTIQKEGSVYAKTDSPYSGPNGERLVMRTLEDVTEVVEADLKLRRRRRSLNFITEISRRFQQKGSLNDKLAWLIEEVISEFDFDSGRIYLLDSSAVKFDLACHKGLSEKFITELNKYPLGGPMYENLLKGEAIYYENFTESPQEPECSARILEAEGIGTLVIIPLVYEGVLCGTINLSMHGISPKRDEELVLMGEVGRGAAMLVANARLTEDIIATEKRFRAIVEHSTAGMMGFDAEGRIALWNDTCERVYGWKAEDIIGSRIVDTVADKVEEEEVEHTIRSVFAGERFPFTENCDTAMDGSLRWTMASKFPLYGPDGSVLMGISTIIDITEQKRMKEALRESENTYRALTEGLQAGVCLISDNKLLYMNPTLEKILGYTLDEINEHPDPFTIIHPDDIRGALEQLGDYLKGGKLSDPYELRIIRGDGKTRHILGLGDLIEYQGRPSVLANVIDITDRYRAEEAIRVSGEMFRLIGENSTDVVLLVVDEQFIYVNPEISRLTGYPEEDFLTGGIGLFDLITPEQRDKVRRQHRDRMAGEDVPPEYELSILTRDGDCREVEAKVTQFKLHGRVATLVNVRDVTARNRMQQQMLVSQKAESVQRLAGGIAHDFNNLLVGIMGNATLLKSEIGDDERLENLLEQMESAARQAAGLTKQLLAYARGGRYQPELIDPVELVKGTLPLLRASLSSGVEITTDFNGDIPCIEADKSQIGQVLMNLGINAAEAMSFRGSLTIRVDTAGGVDGKRVRIDFEDTGPGLPRDVMAKIFDPFFSTKGTGRGMGMAAVFGIMQNHGGTVEMANTPGGGAAFSLLFPFASKKPAKKISPERNSDKGGNEKILVVDDEDIVRDVASAILKKRGYIVFTAAGGKVALSLLADNDDIDLVLLDVVMPGMDGIEACRVIREKYRDMRVLFSSGYNEPGNGENKDAGDGFIHKPYSASELAAKVREILDR